MPHWRKAMKKPIIINVRDIEPNEIGVETLEGYKSCHKDTHFVIRGVEGEEYPIRKDIFFKTYEWTEE